MAYGIRTRPEVSVVMVYDMGGGTLDVSLLHLSNGIFEVMAAAGDNRLGGQDFNLLLLDHLLRQLKKRLPTLDVTADPEAMRALREEAERLKVEMNDECDCAGHFYDGDVGASVEVRLPPALAAAAPLVVTRAEYEAVAAPLFERALAPVRSVLGQVEMPPKDVDESCWSAARRGWRRCARCSATFSTGASPTAPSLPRRRSRTARRSRRRSSQTARRCRRRDGGRAPPAH